LIFNWISKPLQVKNNSKFFSRKTACSAAHLFRPDSAFQKAVRKSLLSHGTICTSLQKYYRKKVAIFGLSEKIKTFHLYILLFKSLAVAMFIYLNAASFIPGENYSIHKIRTAPWLEPVSDPLTPELTPL
jgi:hypothetical protein